MSIKITCNDCGGELDIDDSVFCERCFDEIKDELQEKQAEIDELQERILELEDEILAIKQG